MFFLFFLFRSLLQDTRLLRKNDPLTPKMSEKTKQSPPKQNSLKTVNNKITLKERIENNIALFTLYMLFAGFLFGLGTYRAALEFAQLKTISTQEIEKLKRDSDVSSVSENERIIPESVPLERIEQKSSLIENFIHLLDIEGTFKKQDTDQPQLSNQSQNEKKGFNFGTEALEYNVVEPTKDFNWVLYADASYSLIGLGFRFNRNRNSYEALKIETTATADKISFKVPPCEKGDKLILIVRVESAEGMNIMNITSTFRSISK